MAKGKVKKGKNERTKTSGRVTRSQRRAMERSLSNVGLEDLDTQLRNLGLCTKNITGDGNCLFRALSDQYYGHDSNHKDIRQQVCQFLRENEENYKFFVEDDQSFEHHVECMSQDATYGGNMELAAFAKMKEVHIKVYQPGMIYIINGKEGSGEEDEDIQVLHIAYHSWEHYSSIRNIVGPISGPPEIKVVQQAAEENQNTQEEEDEYEGLGSKEKMIMQACPGTNVRKIKRLLIKHKGDPDKVIDALYEPDPSTVSVEEEENKILEKEKEEEQTILDTKEKSVSEENYEEKKTNVDKDTKVIEEIADIFSPLSDISTTKVNLDDEKETSKEKDVQVIEEKREIDDEKDSEKDEKKDKKPRMQSAAERKREKKLKQKEQKLLKDRAKAARKMQRQKDAADINDISEEKSGSSQQSMKEMYI